MKVSVGRWKVFSLALLTACGPAELGSIAWYDGATQEERIAYYSSACEKYGFRPGTDGMASCIANEINSMRQRRAAFFNSIAQNNSVICTTYGTTTICN